MRVLGSMRDFAVRKPIDPRDLARSSNAGGRSYPSMVSEKFVEARKLTHKIIKTSAGGCELAQRKPSKRTRRRRPQQQRQVRLVATLGGQPALETSGTANSLACYNFGTGTASSSGG